VAEQLAEGLVSEGDASLTRDEAELAVADEEEGQGSEDAREAACYSLDPVAYDAALYTSASAAYAAGVCKGDRTEKVARKAERAAQADILRDIFGNPFRPVAFDSMWLTSTAKALAAAAYDDPTLPAGTLQLYRLAVLADALEDAGCDNGDILGHLRGPGPHVRGCWVLDLLLGKS
jgi:hypothetical protein